MILPYQGLRILCVNQTAALGGGELCLLSEAANLPVPPLTVLFETGPLAGRLNAAALPVEILPHSGRALGIRKRSRVIGALAALPSVGALVWRVARLMRGRHITIANSQKAFVVSALAAYFARTKLIWRLHDVLDSQHFSPYLRRLVIFLANTSARAVIANSKASQSAFIRAGGRAELVSIAYPGLDAAVFDNVSQAEAAALRATITSSKLPLIGMFGRLSPWKGQMVFIEALALVPGCTGIIIGGPLFGEEAFEAALRARISELGLQSRIHLLGFRGDIPALMKAMDIIVHASIAAEPFGRVIVEAMLACKPVIASRDGGAMEIIEHGVTGFLSPPGDAAALARTIQNLLDNPSKAAAAACAGQAHAREMFTIQATTARIAKVIESLV